MTSQQPPSQPGQQPPNPYGMYAPPPKKMSTDFTGGLMGPHQSEGKLIASAFADWKESKNGLVTVYDVKGEILSNGNF
ncbi:hypothetical protein OG528_05720 [Streptomyces platensis]|uniref:hypothetical protein n=1 Tax=Streptomyces platensis TaxID=58346 RepID=UPI0030E1545B